MTNVAVIYYSSTGTNFTMATSVAEGATKSGAEVRVRLVEETAPEAAISANPEWKKFVDAHKHDVRASLNDLTWADAIIVGSPTRFGNVAAQLKAFLDTCGPLWGQGKLANKIYAGFTSAQNQNGGQESTLLSLYNVFYHFGGYIVTPGYTDKLVSEAGGNPYGPSVTVGKGDPPTQADLRQCRYLGERVARVAAQLTRA